jgi:hypothetical protein
MSYQCVDIDAIHFRCAFSCVEPVTMGLRMSGHFRRVPVAVNSIRIRRVLLALLGR